MQDNFVVKRSTLIAAYIAASAYMVGGFTQWNHWACPHETAWQNFGQGIGVVVVWPIAIASEVFGFTSIDTKCLDGSPIRKREADEKSVKARHGSLNK